VRGLDKFQQGERHFVHYAQIVESVLVHGGVVVLGERDVQMPVKLVLDPPMRTDRVRAEFDVSQGGDIEAALFGLLSADQVFRLDIVADE